MTVRLPLDEPTTAAPGVPLDTIEAALTRGFALEIAPPWIVERGIAYAEEGRVHDVQVEPTEVHALVDGSEPYGVRLRREDDEVLADCTCPMGAADQPCKHLVAVALAIAERAAPAPFTARGAVAVEAGDDTGDAGVRMWLLDRPIEELVDLLVEHAELDDRLARRLRLKASRPANGIDLDGYRAAVDEAVSVSPYGYVDWRDSFEWSRGVDEVLDAVAELLDAGHAEAVVELTERTLRRLADVAPSIDGSAGVVGDATARAQVLHLAACEQARPDPEALAERLLHWQLDLDLDIVDDAIASYREVLGAEGVARYRRLLEARWDAVAPVRPGDDPGAGTGRWQLDHLMRQLVEATGDLDDLIEVLRQDLSRPHRFQQLAEACADGGRTDDAIGWLRQGHQHFPDADGLSDRLSDRLVESGDVEGALEVELAAFITRPTLPRYQRLQPLAQRLGRWEEVRGAALGIAAEREAEAGQAGPAPSPAFTGSRSWMPRADRSLTVSILLWEGKTDEAWEVATEGGCSDVLWRRLADARATTHPRDALEVRRRELQQALGPADRGAYDRVAEVLLAMRPSYERLDDRAGFDQLVDEVRCSYRRRRLLLERLDRAGLVGTREGP